MLILKRPWTRQPQTDVGIDRSHPLTRGALHWWHLHPQFAFKDLVGSAHGTPTDLSYAATSAGSIAALYANSTSTVNCGDIEDINFGNGASTFGVCLYVDSLAANTVVLGKDDATNGRQFHMQIATNGAISWVNGITNGAVTAASTIVAGNFYNIIYTRDNSDTQSIYVNGVRKTTGVQSAANSNQNANFCIGSRTYAGALNPVAGKIEQAFILNRSWTAAEAMQHAGNRFAVFAPLRIPIPTAAAAAGAPTITALSARSITATSAQPRISYS